MGSVETASRVGITEILQNTTTGRLGAARKWTFEFDFGEFAAGDPYIGSRVRQHVQIEVSVFRLWQARVWYLMPVDLRSRNAGESVKT